MRTIILLFILFNFAHSLLGQEAEYEYDYVFFENSLMPGYYFYSAAKYSDGSYIYRFIIGKKRNKAYSM